MPRVVCPTAQQLSKRIGRRVAFGRVLLAGGGSMVKGLDTAVERAMKERLGSGRVIRIEEPIYGFGRLFREF